MDYTRRAGLYLPLNKQVIPASDLGLEQAQFPDLTLFDDIPVVLALQAIQTPGGPRLMTGSQAGSSGLTMSSWALYRQATTDIGAGSVGLPAPPTVTNFFLYITLTALGGAPTSITYSLDGGFDGVTWYAEATSVVTTTGLVCLGWGISPLAKQAGVVGSAVQNGGALPFNRLSWSFIGGTAPSATQTMWIAYR